MAKEHYSEAVKCKLSDIITPDVFRTILYEQSKLPLGITEIPVEITLKKEAADKLSFPIPSDGIIYGVARLRDTVKERYGSENAKLFINDWEHKGLAVFELDNDMEKAFYVEISEVIELLENCLRVPEHRIKK
ncbi:MAG: hypothetical protein K5979_09840 [Ruminococcus sp.]|nr:hypothetical protein [Ruminococcus sp.]